MATTIGLREYAVHLSRVPAELQAGLYGLMLDVARQGEDRTARNITNRLTMRSQKLLRSVRVDVAETDGALQVTWAVGTTDLRVRYARLQEEGGVVKPVKGKFLAIPQEPAMTGPGINKYPEVRRAPHLYFRKTEKGGVLVNRHTGEVWYVLVRKVTIPARHYLRDAITETVKDLPAAINAVVVDTMAVS